VISIVDEPSSYVRVHLDAWLLITQFDTFLNIHAYRCQLRCSVIDSKGFPDNSRRC